MLRFAASRLRQATAAALVATGVPARDAELVADSFLEAELEGQASHGLSRLPLLLDRLRTGLVNPRPSMTLSGDRPAAILLDADNGPGPIAGLRAVQVASERAHVTGAAVVGVRRSNHLGSLGFYLRRFTADGVIGVVFTNTPPAMPPPGSSIPFLGTNPIAAGFPTGNEPVIIDMATSQVARGRILKAARVGEPIPEGWAVDSEGLPTTDPEAAIAGSLLPMGGDKGFALALLVEVLSGVLSGAAVGPEVGGTYIASDRESNVGHCFIAIDPGALTPTFGDRMDRLARDIRAVGGRLPGDRRHVERARRLDEGIELADDLIAELQAHSVSLS